MSKIRINDLARELEVKSKTILDVLLEVGVTEKKTHSSSLEEHEAEKVRAHFHAASDGRGGAKSARGAKSDTDGIKPKIDLSHISKPGDVLKAILAKQKAAAPAEPAPLAKPAAPVTQEAKPAVPVAKPAAPVPSTPAATTPARPAPLVVPPKPAAPVS